MDMKPAHWGRDYRHTLGASEIAGVVGFSRYSTPDSLYREKVFGRHQEPPNDDMLRGLCLERGLLDWWSRKHNDKCTPQLSSAMDGSYRWAAATLDGLSESGVVVETKCPRRYDAWDVRTGKHPFEYHLQIQWQMGVARCEGLARVERGVLVAGPKDGQLLEFPVTYNTLLFATLLECGREFMSLVAFKQPPTADNALRWNLRIQPFCRRFVAEQSQ